MNKDIGQTRCAVVRECANNSCIFKMLYNGYMMNPRNDLEKRRNISMERSFGKGNFPKLSFRGRSDFIDIVCENYIDR